MEKIVMEDYEIEEAYKAMLDDVYPVVKIGYSEFYPSDILKNCDPIAYRIGLSEYEDYLAEEAEDEENLEILLHDAELEDDEEE